MLHSGSLLSIPIAWFGVDERFIVETITIVVTCLVSGW